MKKIIYLVFPLLACLLVLGACGNKEDEKSYKEINDFYTGKLSSSDENVKLTVYQNSDDEDIYFVETVNNRTHSIYHYLWNSKDKKKSLFRKRNRRRISK